MFLFNWQSQYRSIGLDCVIGTCVALIFVLLFFFLMQQWEKRTDFNQQWNTEIAFLKWWNSRNATKGSLSYYSTKWMVWWKSMNEFYIYNRLIRSYLCTAILCYLRINFNSFAIVYSSQHCAETKWISFFRNWNLFSIDSGGLFRLLLLLFCRYCHYMIVV